MTWELFFLGCFAFGFVLSLLAFLGGSAHLHLHHGGHGGHGHGHSGVSKFNFGTIAAFLTWFGGAGDVLMHWGGLGLVLILALAGAVGFEGSATIPANTPFLFATGAFTVTPVPEPSTSISVVAVSAMLLRRKLARRSHKRQV